MTFLRASHQNYYKICRRQSQIMGCTFTKSEPKEGKYQLCQPTSRESAGNSNPRGSLRRQQSLEILEIVLKLSTQPQEKKPQQSQRSTTNTLMEEKPKPQLVIPLIENNEKDEFNKLLSQCLKHYQQHNIDKAFKVANQILQKYKVFVDETEQCQRQLQYICEEFHQMMGLHQQVNRPGWQQKSNSNGVKISFRKQDNGGIVCCMEKVLEVPYDLMITSLIEFQLLKQFVPFLQDACILKKAQRNTRIGSAVMKFPLSNPRSVHFLATGYNRLEQDGTVFMFTIPFIQRLDLQKKYDYFPVEDPGAVRLLYKYMALVYSPICEGKGTLKVYAFIEKGAQLLPGFILEWVSIKFANEFLNRIVDVAKNFTGSKWEQKTKEDPSTVDFNRIVIKQYNRRQASK